LLGGVLAVTAIAFAIRFGVRGAVRIIAVPLAALAGALAFAGATGQLFSLFNLFAMLLVLGIGIDYAVFFHLGGSRNLPTALAVILSAGTTLAAFGVLSFSDTAVISAFGGTLFGGIATAFLVAPLAGVARAS
jgi:predicted exporter